ncbi:MAG: DNA repair protein RecN [Calditrichaeota bacterium]|nr:DNA repair protein RecN [Calditrichota bacterium]
MLKSLYIKNFALVEELFIRFSEGLNIITGETGAGKTIIVNAIAQLCGERSSVELVRKGAAKAILEAEIEFRPRDKVLKILQDLTLDSEINSTIILRKEITAKGISRTFINDTPVPLSRLNELSSYLIDIHGQHQHQRLLHPENHLEYLDAFGKLNALVGEFEALLKTFRAKVKERDDLRAKQLKSTQLQDMYRFQMDELTKAELQPDELETLSVELKRLNNIEYIHQFASAINDLLYQGEPSASGLIADAEDKLDKLLEFDRQFSEFKESLVNARESVEEIGRFLTDYLSELEFDPERLEQIQERINHLEFLLKKYQKASLMELIDYLNEIRNFSGDLEQFEERIQELNAEISELKQKIEQSGAELSAKRKEFAKAFEKQITEILSKVGMPNARFRVRFSFKENSQSVFVIDGKPVEVGDRGFDLVVFELSSNAGEDFKPLHKIVSGGELSRIMLALKSLLITVDHVPSMIFDEIDSGISGKVAQIVGLRMLELSKNHQILCVTHLPQIAAFAQAHFKVLKNTEDNRTSVDIKKLDEDGRIREIAGLLGGREIAEQTLENARHLISEAAAMKTD